MENAMEVAEVAARAAGENFPVGSVLFPRALRPHVRALYCYARFVDELGDAYEGDRLAALDELEAQLALTFEGEPTWPILRNVQPIRASRTVCALYRSSSPASRTTTAPSCRSIPATGSSRMPSVPPLTWRIQAE